MGQREICKIFRPRDAFSARFAQEVAIFGGMDALLLGRRIRFYRKEAGLTLDELSAKVDRPKRKLWFPD